MIQRQRTVHALTHMQVLLVGGATRMPAFRRFITNVTGLQPRPAAVDPDEVK